MVLHRAYGVLISSSVPLPEIPLVWVTGPHIEFHFLLNRSISEARCCEGLKWLHQSVLSDGTFWISSASLGEEYVVRFAGTADFLVSADKSRITCYSQANIPEETIRHLLLDYVLPCL